MEICQKIPEITKISFFSRDLLTLISSKDYKKTQNNQKKNFHTLCYYFHSGFPFLKNEKVCLWVYGDTREQYFRKNTWFSWAYILVDIFLWFFGFMISLIFLKQYCFNQNIEILCFSHFVLYFFSFWTCFVTMCWYSKRWANLQTHAKPCIPRKHT